MVLGLKREQRSGSCVPFPLGEGESQGSCGRTAPWKKVMEGEGSAFLGACSVTVVWLGLALMHAVVDTVNSPCCAQKIDSSQSPPPLALTTLS